jgi:DNA-binding Lrp family transcriptional regulator
VQATLVLSRLGAEADTWILLGTGPPDLRTVDLVGRLWLAAGRMGYECRLVDVGVDLAGLFDLVGLAGHLACSPPGDLGLGFAGNLVCGTADARPGLAQYARRMVHAFVLIDGEPGRVADLAVELAEVEGVAEVYSVAGHADIVAVVRVRRHEELAEVVTRRISALAGVTDTRTLIAFQAYSRRDLEAIWDLGQD